MDDEDPDLFELVLGSVDGRIFMRTIMIESIEADDIQFSMEVSLEMNTKCFATIHDIKATKVSIKSKTFYLMIATSETKLFQFVAKGQGMMDIFELYKKDEKKIEAHSIVTS